MERMHGDLVLGDVVKAVLEGPVRQGVDLRQSSADGGVLEQVDVSTLKTVIPPTAVDHHVGVEGLQASLEGLDLADLVVLFDVNLPQIRAKLLVVFCLVRTPNRLEDVGLELVVPLQLAEECHGLRKQMEGVDDHDLDLAALEVPKPVKKVGDDTISRNHGVGKDSVLKLLDLFESKHSLLLQVLQSLVLGLLNQRLHVERHPRHHCLLPRLHTTVRLCCTQARRGAPRKRKHPTMVER
mmetsp:Transcript_13005/g.29900  ORF Transcript_13005/g.29900 Transcript_13005/m.29900 type:complete len:239 (+) Transcript_13005:627-1343(+)